MSIDTAISKTTLKAVSERAAQGSAAPASPNVAVIATIEAHHAALAARLDVLTEAVLAALPDGPYAPARDELHAWYVAELLPHVVAEEQALYSKAADLDPTRLLICGMLAEHRSLVSLVAVLAEAAGPIETATSAAVARAVFTVHVTKENDLLLPALAQSGLDLAAALDGMHEILGHEHAADAEDAGCGCGCGCSDGADGQSSGTLQIVAEPTGGAEELDVRTLPHGARHEIIFGKLDLLEPGQALVIVNDHDPKPLRYQASAMWPDRFDWNYLESGPDTWRVAIIRAG